MIRRFDLIASPRRKGLAIGQAGVDLCLGKTAGCNYGNNPEYLVDGNDATFWSTARACSYSVPTYGYVDLGATFPINRIVVVMNGSIIMSWRLFVGGHPVSLQWLVGCAYSFASTGSALRKVFDFDTVHGRFVAIQMNYSNGWSNWGNVFGLEAYWVP